MFVEIEPEIIILSTFFFSTPCTVNRKQRLTYRRA